MDRLLILVIPVLGIIYPLAQDLPAVYDRIMRHRIYQLYAELRFLEDKLNQHHAGEKREDFIAQLTRLEKKANLLKVPVAYADYLYTLRDHIILVRTLLQSPQEHSPAASVETGDTLENTS